MRPRRFIPANTIERDVLASMQAEARRTNRPLADVVAEAINEYVAKTDHLRVA